MFIIKFSSCFGWSVDEFTFSFNHPVTLFWCYKYWETSTFPSTNLVAQNLNRNDSIQWWGGKKMSESKEEWSKERIQAEMEDLNRSKQTYLSVAILLISSGVCSSFFSLTMMSSPLYVYAGGVAFLFLILGIILLIPGILLLSSYFQKSRQYNELKRKL